MKIFCYSPDTNNNGLTLGKRRDAIRSDIPDASIEVKLTYKGVNLVLFKAPLPTDQADLFCCVLQGSGCVVSCGTSYRTAMAAVINDIDAAEQRNDMELVRQQIEQAQLIVAAATETPAQDFWSVFVRR